MNPSPFIILGSSRKNSDTLSYLDKLYHGVPKTLIDLLDYRIYPYDYESNYPPDDDFGAIIQQLLSHQHIVFATPVYWYSMSGLMKAFFDRLTDLLTIRKEWGRKLKGKTVFLMAVGAEDELPEGLEIPFRRTADYLDMEYGGTFYFSTKSHKNKE